MLTVEPGVGPDGKRLSVAMPLPPPLQAVTRHDGATRESREFSCSPSLELGHPRDMDGGH